MDDPPSKAGHPHFQAAEILQGTDRSAEPAAHGRAGVAGQKRADAERRIQFLPQRLPAAVFQPGLMFNRRQAIGRGGEQRSRRHLSGPEQRCRVRHFGGAVLHRVEDRKRRYQFARRMHADLQTSFAEPADLRRQPFGGNAGTRHVLRPGCHHPHFPHRRGGNGRGRQQPAARHGGRCCQKSSSRGVRHVSPSVC